MAELKKEILLDIRESALLDKLDEYDKTIWLEDYESRHKIYIKWKKSVSELDSERWPKAIESYKKYECFSKKHTHNFFFNDEPILCYGDNDSFVRITADILTNVETINKLVDKVKPLKDEEKQILQAFYRVSYTIGAICPIWHNVGPGPGACADIVWNKLRKSGIYDENGNIKASYIGIDERENVSNLRRRTDTDLFMIFPKDSLKSVCDIATKLYFQDFFDYNWKLICPVISICDKYFQERNHIFDFISQLVVLTVQRSYRILQGQQDNDLNSKDREIIMEVLGDLGLKNEKCIYSAKRSLTS